MKALMKPIRVYAVEFNPMVFESVFRVIGMRQNRKDAEKLMKRESNKFKMKWIRDNNGMLKLPDYVAWRIKSYLVR